MQENITKQSNKYEAKRQQKLDKQARTAKEKRVKKISTTALMVLIAGGVIGWLVWYVANQPKTPESEIISREGIHWHPELTILIKGQKQEIDPNLGIGAVHRAIHTHDTTGVLHLEMQGLVKKENTVLGEFFNIWGKQFNANCILESCNGPDGTVKMSVNGQENAEFGNYPMKDKDKIEIRYE